MHLKGLNKTQWDNFLCQGIILGHQQMHPIAVENTVVSSAANLNINCPLFEQCLLTLFCWAFLNARYSTMLTSLSSGVCTKADTFYQHSYVILTDILCCATAKGTLPLAGVLASLNVYTYLTTFHSEWLSTLLSLPKFLLALASTTFCQEELIIVMSTLKS